MRPCAFYPDKELYLSRHIALAALEGLIAHAKRTREGGKSWKRLNVFKCCNGQHWHIGRKHEPPSASQIRSHLKRIYDAWGQEQRRHAKAITKLIEADRKLGLI